MVVVIVGTAAIAGAKVNKLRGTFPSDANATISMGLKLNKKGKVKKVVDIKYENVDIQCNDGTTGEISGTARDAKVTEPRPGQPGFSTAGAEASISGLVQSKKAVSGSFLGVTPDGSCGTALDHGASNPIGFSARK